MNAALVWRPVAPRFFAHRPEPLATERLWACRAEVTPEYFDELDCRYEAGLDRYGRARALKQVDLTGGSEGVHLQWREDTATERVLRTHSGPIAITTDDATRYPESSAGARFGRR